MRLSLEEHKPKSAQLVVAGLVDLTSGHHCESQYRSSIRPCVPSWLREVWEYSEPRKTPFLLFLYPAPTLKSFQGGQRRLMSTSAIGLFSLFSNRTRSLYRGRCDLLLQVLAVSGNSPARNYQQMNHSFGKVANSLGSSSGTAVKSAVVLFARCLH